MKITISLSAYMYPIKCINVPITASLYLSRLTNEIKPKIIFFIKIKRDRMMDFLLTLSTHVIFLFNLQILCNN